MATCPTTPNPSAAITEGLQLYPPLKNKFVYGDYTVAGIGTRNFGTGVIKVRSIPPKTTVLEAYLIYNTYQSNNQPNPSVTIKNGNKPAVPVSATLYGICGSTCWLNPPHESTAPYLRNRVYISNDISSVVNGNGKYTVAGLPVDLTMPISTDGIRVPGCKSSQGAVLLIIWAWVNNGGPKNPALIYRGINVYLGAKLIDPTPKIWGGSKSYTLNFTPAVSGATYYAGNNNMATAAGDAKITVGGDSLTINTVTFVPPYHAWERNGGPALSVKKMGLNDIYNGTANSAIASTSFNCIDWFFFVTSGDITTPKATFQIINCAATFLSGSATIDEDGDITTQSGDINNSDTNILVWSNYVDPAQVGSGIPGPPCRAARFVPINNPVPPNYPGHFPDAPFFISIDKEIMQVTKKQGQGATGPGVDTNGVTYPDPNVWTVTRGAAGTTVTSHTYGSCVFLLAPPKFQKFTRAGLAARGQPAQRPSPGRPKGKRKSPKKK